MFVIVEADRLSAGYPDHVLLGERCRTDDRLPTYRG
jgi:hypothetical protein